MIVYSPSPSSSSSEDEPEPAETLDNPEETVAPAEIDSTEEPSGLAYFAGNQEDSSDGEEEEEEEERFVCASFSYETVKLWCYQTNNTGKSVVNFMTIDLTLTTLHHYLTVPA